MSYVFNIVGVSLISDFFEPPTAILQQPQFTGI